MTRDMICGSNSEKPWTAPLCTRLSSVTEGILRTSKALSKAVRKVPGSVGKRLPSHDTILGYYYTVPLPTLIFSLKKQYIRNDRSQTWGLKTIDLRILVPRCTASRSLRYFAQRSADIKPAACPGKDESRNTNHLQMTRTYLGQSHVRVVTTKSHAVLGPRGKHSVYDSASVMKLTRLVASAYTVPLPLWSQDHQS